MPLHLIFIPDFSNISYLALCKNIKKKQQARCNYRLVCFNIFSTIIAIFQGHPFEFLHYLLLPWICKALSPKYPINQTEVEQQDIAKLQSSNTNTKNIKINKNVMYNILNLCLLSAMRYKFCVVSALSGIVDRKQNLFPQ